jgi:hypothetical protein
VAKSSPGVENGCVECTSERALGVGAEAVVDYASLCLRAYADPGSAPVPSLRPNNNSQSMSVPILFSISSNELSYHSPSRRTSSPIILHRHRRLFVSRNAIKRLWKLTKVAPSSKVPADSHSQSLPQVYPEFPRSNASMKLAGHLDGVIGRALHGGNRRVDSLPILPKRGVTTRSHNLRRSHRE